MIWRDYNTQIRKTYAMIEALNKLAGLGIRKIKPIKAHTITLYHKLKN
ncbi:hypothetical protein BTN50_1079 [Candidatus Enterovibrio altilux]|uniref:Mobile element protein n=1 Tax=Candidatus Enterovibrio altilux TaxID=1927128 RepID=A0A291B9C0_9GAMM|nr:hypothetical protein BTN50_1079 [Candidatus Enterovibrio luxaltus]